VISVSPGHAGVGPDETRRVARQHQAWARRFWSADLAVESDLGRQQLELQRIALAGEEVTDLSRGGVGAAVGGVGGVRSRVSGTLERGVSFSSSKLALHARDRGVERER